MSVLIWNCLVLAIRWYGRFTSIYRPSITADTETDYHLKFGMLEDLFGNVDLGLILTTSRILFRHMPPSTRRVMFS